MAETSQSAKPQTNEFPFSVSVGQVYDGPLDLLLDLVRKQDIDIYDIPIAKITAQYLGYVENLKHLDVDIAAEFIYMASLLNDHARAEHYDLVCLPHSGKAVGDHESRTPLHQHFERILHQPLGFGIE